MPLPGKHNVLNALAAVALAFGRGVECEAIERALATFQGVRRRLEVKGEAAGVTIVEDFAHHPTAIQLTLEAARTRWPGCRIWVAIEPRSNTMRRKFHEAALPDALNLAHGVLFGPVNRPHLLSDTDRFSPEHVAAEIRARGHRAEALSSAAAIAEFLAGELKPGDLVLVMSNGSFDGLCGLLLEALGKREEVKR
jgi:UDP-N-acetylmuramate: L-alanyl-gamma-D-glutamyl-meso-diaminopimelate ligase